MLEVMVAGIMVTKHVTVAHNRDIKTNREAITVPSIISIINAFAKLVLETRLPLIML